MNSALLWKGEKLILQIAYNLRSGTQILQDWGATFPVAYRGTLVLVTARHVLGVAKLTDPLHVMLRAPNSSAATAWKGLLSPLVHPKADLAVFPAPAGLSLTPLNIAPAAAGAGDAVELVTLPNAGLSMQLGPSATISGNVLRLLPISTTGRFSELAFETTLPAAPGSSGAPVLDVQGDVVGLYSRQSSHGREESVCVTLDGLSDLL